MVTQVKCYQYGSPYNTEAAVCEVEKTAGNPQNVTIGAQVKKTVIEMKLNSKDQVLGLGQVVGPQNRRGRVYESWCTDAPRHTPDATALYGAHPFFIIVSEACEGFWIDFPGRIHFDIGHTKTDLLKITVHGTDFNMYTFGRGTLAAVVQTFRKHIGKPYVPPKWGFGHIQSRWGYKNRADIDAVIEGYAKHQLPLEAICLDIDYMENYKDFTVDAHKFPKVKEWVRAVKEKGIQLIPIIDAGVKVEKGYPVYEEGVAQNFFVTNQEGDPFTAAVWPGKCHFPDFLNPKARQWFGKWYKALLDLGFEGFWNDMNEPALFYTEKGLENALDLAESSRGKNLDIDSYFQLKSIFENLMNNLEDYQTMTHQGVEGIVNHEQIHNMYGMNMTRAAAEGFKINAPDKRILMFSRASAIGAHRHGGIWLGDNHSWWEHLLLNVRMMPSLNYCGFLYCGADTGGFSGDASPELLIRWYQFSMFTPLFRNHAALGTRAQEPFAFDLETVGILNKSLNLRYAFIPWLYSEYMKAIENDNVMFKPMQWDWNCERAKAVDDQLLLGDALMLAPIVQPSAKGRMVWVPETMAVCKVKDHHLETWNVLEAGEHFVEVNLEETLLFLRLNKMFTLLQAPSNNTSLAQSNTLMAVVFTDSEATATLYDDDGTTPLGEHLKSSELYLHVRKQNFGYEAKAHSTGICKYSKVCWIVIDTNGNITPIETQINA